MSDTSSAARLHWGNAHVHFLTHLAVMPTWHKAVILIAGLFAVLGTVGQIVAKVGGDAHIQVTTGSSPAPVAGNGFASGNSDSPRTEERVGSLSRVSPHATGFGLSVVLGFIIGWLFRAFLKTMAFVALLVGGGIWLLAHFNILHVEESQIDVLREKSADVATWLGTKGRHLKDMAVAHLPSSGGGALGAFMGLRRR